MLEEKDEPFYKKIWFWIIAIVIVFGVASYGGSKK
ncbi:hypothetical protein CFSAN002368_08185 [Clostridium botulinum A1 str. CFSAN002368]|nr:hypothetical protein CFSAN002368_08185 [Clostridium botulinum A1 str. CFSAN002368]